MIIYLLRMPLLAILIGFAPGAAHGQALSEAAEKFFKEHVAPHIAHSAAESLKKEFRCWHDQICEPGTDPGAGAQFRDLSASDRAALVRRAFPAVGSE